LSKKHIGLCDRNRKLSSLLIDELLKELSSKSLIRSIEYLISVYGNIKRRRKIMLLNECNKTV
jgi:hypothetical protein